MYMFSGHFSCDANYSVSSQSPLLDRKHVVGFSRIQISCTAGNCFVNITIGDIVL